MSERYWAKLDASDIVRQVIVCDENPQRFLDGTWVETTKENYAGPGHQYHRQSRTFLPQRPFLSWTASSDRKSWEPPVPKPATGHWKWNEVALQWVPFT